MDSNEVNVDYYSALEVPKTASTQLVTQSYRRLTKLHHPDRNLGKADTTAEFQLVKFHGSTE